MFDNRWVKNALIGSCPDPVDWLRTLNKVNTEHFKVLQAAVKKKVWQQTKPGHRFVCL